MGEPTTPKKSGWLSGLGMQAAGGVVNTGLGMILGRWNDRRQLRQQQKLQELEMQGNKEMMDYSMMKELEMWNATGYGAQKDQMKEAGINPALMYGMGGGGGQTVGSPTGNVEGGDAPRGGGEIPAVMGMGMQLALLKAQKENIEADTANKLSQVPGHQGIPAVQQQQIAGGKQEILESQQRIKESESRIDKLAQETTNEQLKWNLINVELGLKHLQQYIANKTADESIEIVKTELKEKNAHLRSSMAKANVDEKTQDSIIDEHAGKAALVWAQKKLAESNITVNDEQKKLIMQQVDYLMHDTVQGYNKNKLEAAANVIHAYNARIKAAAIPMEAMTGVLQGVLQIMTLDKLIQGGKTKPGTVSGFGRGNNPY